MSVTVLDDAHDEGGERFLLKPSGTAGARVGDGRAVGTIESPDVIPKAWIARFGHTVTGQVPDMVSPALRP